MRISGFYISIIIRIFCVLFVFAPVMVRAETQQVPETVLTQQLAIAKAVANRNAEPSQMWDQEEASLQEVGVPYGVFSSRENMVQRTKSAVRLYAKKEYFSLAKYQQLIELHKQYMEELLAHSDTVSKLYKKGLVAKIEVLKIKRRKEDANRKLLEMKCELNKHLIVFGRAIKSPLHEGMRFEDLPFVMDGSKNFEEWLKVGLYNSQLITKNSMDASVTQYSSILPADEEARLRDIHSILVDKMKQVEATQTVIAISEEVLGIQKRLFMNAFSASDEIGQALSDFYEEKEKHFELLYSYNNAWAEAEYIFEDMRERRATITSEK